MSSSACIFQRAPNAVIPLSPCPRPPPQPRSAAKVSAAERAAYWAAGSARRAQGKQAATDDLALGKLDELAKREDRVRTGCVRGGGSGWLEEGGGRLGGSAVLHRAAHAGMLACAHAAAGPSRALPGPA